MAHREFHQAAAARYETYDIWLCARAQWVAERLKEKTGAATLSEVLGKALAVYHAFAVYYKKPRRITDDTQSAPELLTILSVVIPPGASRRPIRYGTLKIPAKCHAAFRKLYILKTDEHSFVVENALTAHYNLLERYSSFPLDTTSAATFSGVEFIEADYSYDI